MIGQEFCNVFQERWNLTHSYDDRISKPMADDLCHMFLDLLDEQFDTMEAGDKILFYGFGAFQKKVKAARVVGNIKSGVGTCEIPEHETITFVRSRVKK